MALFLAACGGSTNPTGGPHETRTVASLPPAGGTIAFVRSGDGGYAIFVMRANGSDQHALSKVHKEASPTRRYFQDAPAWSPDGKRIAFASDRSGSLAIHVMNADGSGTRRLTSGRGGDYAPSWSPDGKRIAFSRGRHVYVMNADGSGVRALAKDPLARDYDPAWSPDGETIVFVRKKLGSAALYAMRSDGSLVHRLTAFAWSDYSPAWSPDGRSIAFSSTGTGRSFDIFVVSADGKGERKLTRSPTDDDFHPAWSPDGSRIAFSRGATIYVMRSDGSSLVRLTGQTIDGSPAWRP